MKRRFLALLLAAAMLMSLCTGFASAADTESEALGEVQIFNGGTELSYLSINGRVQSQIYTYYKYKMPDGTLREIPAYCVNPNIYGVPQSVSPGESISYLAEEKSSDPKVLGIVANGFPTKTLGELKLENKYQAYYATKMALWCYILPTWDISRLKVNPNLSGEELTRAKAILDAAKGIYVRGTAWNEALSPRLTAVADRSAAYPVAIDGQQYKQQVFTIHSDTWVCDRTVAVTFSKPDAVPQGTRIVDMDNKDITEVSTKWDGDGYGGQFKILYPAKAIGEEDGSIQLAFSANVYKFAVYYAVCAEQGKYGQLQNYMVDTDPTSPIHLSTYSNYTGGEIDPPGEDLETGLRIIKLEQGTDLPLSGAVFEVVGPDGATVGSFASDYQGEVLIPLTLSGNYTVYERTPPKNHLLSDTPTQNINVEYGKVAEVTFWNAPYGSLRVEKRSDTGMALPGAVIAITHVESGQTYTAESDFAGNAIFDQLKPGAYRIQEQSAPSGWQKDDTVFTTTVTAGETTTFPLVNKELPGLRIIKYDRKNMTAMPNVAFEIFRDGVSLGKFRTDEFGEILLTNAKPGTYLAQEVDTGSDGHILDTTPQQVELAAGDGIKELLFFNDVKPGLHLVKVDATDPSKVIPNAVFEIKSVAGDYGPQEFTTDEHGEIDLSKLPAGAYVVTEKSCPGYVIDEAQRIIQLDPNEDAEFVFTNSIKPSLQLIKTSADGSRLSGVTFRIAKIADGTHYLDRTTNAQGEILISGLEPGVYSVKETATVQDHLIDPKEYHVELFPGQTSTIVIQNQKRPSLTIHKNDADTGAPVAGTVFTVKAADGSTVNEVKTGPDGTATLRNLLPIVYEVTEKSVPSPYLLDAPSQLITLYPNRDSDLYFENHKRPSLTINKVDSITGSPIKGAKFEVWYGSNNTSTGELNSLGVFFSDANGQIVIDKLRDGWYKVTELEPASGFTIKEPATQEVYIKGGESKVLTFQNVPKNAIVVEKYDSVTGEALPGCTFQLRYLGGTSGTGGTAIGTKVTGKNGTAIWTGLNPGAYVLEEVDAADGYNIIQSSETIMLADSGEQSVITVRFKNAPDGTLLIRKVCATNPSMPLQNAEFKVAYADGTLIGDGNGVFRTDENGEIRITGLKPGKSVVVTETRAPDGFILDTQSQTIQIKEGRTVSITFKNQPKGSLIIQKRDSHTNEPLSGAEFRVTTAAGCEVGLDGVIGTSTLTQNGIFVTDAQGEIRISNLAPGAYVINEIKAPDGGYVIDTPSTNVVIGQGGDTQTVIIKNTRKGGLIVEKYDSVTKQPLSGAQFKITNANGELVPDNEGLTSSNGLYTTDVGGQIVLSKLLPGTYVVSEVKAPDNYQADPTPQTVVVNAGDTQTLRFYNDPLCTLTILKRDAVTQKPLKGAEFTVKDSEGRVVGPNSGRYVTGTDGTVTVSGLTPNGTYVVSESKAPTGYIKDETPKNIVVRTGAANSLTFDNEPATTLIIRKFIEGTENEPLSGVAFKVVDGNGGAVGPDDGVYYTDKAGEIVLEGLEPGMTVVAREIKTVEGYVLDGTPQDILIKAGEAQQLTFWNKKAGTLVIQKKDRVSGALIAGAQFQLTYANGGYVDNDNGHLSSNGLYTTDDKGEIRISGITGTVVVKETKPAPGYVIDQSTQTQTVTVNPLDTQTLTFLNEPLCSLTLTKLDSVTGKPVPGTEFTVKDGNGTVLGRYTTGKDGTVVVTGLVPGSTVVVTETKVPNGYVLDSPPQTIIVKNGSNSVNSGTAGGTTNVTPGGTTNVGGGTNGGNDLTFENDPKTRLVIEKYITGTTTPLKGVTFLVTESNGQVLGSANGEYTTDENGRIEIEGLEPGVTIIAKEIRTLEGFLLDSTPKSIQIKVGDAQTLKFYNTPVGGVEILKVNEADKSERIPNTTFEIRRIDDGLVDTVITDKNGRVFVTLEDGAYYATEVEAAEGFKLDPTPHYFEVKDGKCSTVTVTNRAFSGILLHKIDSATRKGIYGVTFLLYDGNMNPVDQFTTDQNGYAYIDTLELSGKVFLRELENNGYIVDEQLKTVYVKPGETTEITWENTAITAQIQIVKKSADYNPTNGLPAGTLLEGAVFEITDKAGNLVDTIRSDSRGLAVSKPLPLSRYTIREVKAPANYGVSDQELTAYLEHEGQIVRFEVTNKSMSTGVSITKTGPKEIMGGQPVRYTFSGIANNSNVRLDSFYWRDTLPAEVRLDTVVTGTYNFPGTYKITYRVNGGEPRTLADNLSTSKNYTLAASPVALGLASNQRVTEIMFVFGQAPAGFAQVEAPALHCIALAHLSAKSFVNVADVGGVYNGQWVQAVSRWVTNVYGKPVPALPRTGY